MSLSPDSSRRAPSRHARHRLAAIGALLVMLGGCSTVVMNPAGDVARQQADLIVWSVVLMLLVIVPVMALTVFFAWRYRDGADATYKPEWDHSTQLELVIWAAPLLIIIALGALTWVGTHTLDPYRPLERTAPGRPVTANVRPLEVQVVSLDWKWLFIYPEQGIATVNDLVLPVDRPVRFRLTSSSVMNAFWVPALAGMIYTMPGMETKLHAVFNRTGSFEGMSANYSGAGFSGMKFVTRSVAPAAFDQWVGSVRAQPRRLDAALYLELEKPSEKVAPVGFGTVDPALFGRAVGMCVKPGTVCAMGHQGVPPRRGEAEGALSREPGEKGESEHMFAPHPDAPDGPVTGADINRNTTRPDRRAPRAIATPVAAG